MTAPPQRDGYTCVTNAQEMTKGYIIVCFDLGRCQNDSGDVLNGYLKARFHRYSSLSQDYALNKAIYVVFIQMPRGIH